MPAAARTLLVLAPIALLASPPAAAQCVEGCTAIYEFTGEAAGDQFGWVSDDLGDLDGDGVHDLGITAPFHNGNLGRVYVYSGATGELLFPPIDGLVTAGQLGMDIDPAGDVDGDGTGDIIVGSPTNGAGRAFVYSGVTGLEIRTFNGDSSGDSYGASVAGLGDINGDGFSDVAVAATAEDTAGTNAGRVYVYSGGDSTLLCTVEAESSFDTFGSGLALAGDTDGDGVNDFVVGARNAGTGGPGRAYVYSGAACAAGAPSDPLVLTPPGGATDFGWFFLDHGDMNGDGQIDIYVSDFSFNAAHVFDGSTGKLLRTYTGTGGFGIGRFVGDVDGDCADDLILASWVHPGGGTQAGKADIFSGENGSILETFTHDVPFAQWGFDANGMGDVDGDGTTDYLITAAGDSGATGKAYVIAGGFADPCPADIDCSGTVDFVDLLAVLASWGDSGVPADVDGSGTVDFVDLLAVLAAWGPC